MHFFVGSADAPKQLFFVGSTAVTSITDALKQLFFVGSAGVTSIADALLCGQYCCNQYYWCTQTTLLFTVGSVAVTITFLTSIADALIQPFSMKHSQCPLGRDVQWLR